MDPGTILSVAAGLKRLGVRPLKWMRDRREKKRAEERDLAAAAGGEFLFDDEEGSTMKLKGKLTYASIAALVIGLVSELLGIDIAPTEVDAIATAAATAGALYGRWRATRAPGS